MQSLLEDTIVPRRKKLELDLGEQLTIAHVHDAKAAWAEVVSGTGDVTLNGAELGRVDTAGLQLILVLKASLESNARAVNWDGVSPELKEAASTINMTDALGIE